MKQVIITIRDVDGGLRGKKYFNSVDDYLYNATEYIDKNLGPCYEVELKAGRQFKTHKLESDLQSDANYNLTSITKEIDSWVTCNAYYVEKYLKK